MRNLIKGFLAFGLVVGPIAAQASTVIFSYSDIVSSSSVTGVSSGELANIIIDLDNGASSLNSQTWTASNLQSVTFSFGGGAVQSTAIYPGDALSYPTGSFITNASGVLTSVPISWVGNFGPDYTTTGTGSSTPQAFFVNGANAVYFTTSGGINLQNVRAMLSPASWSVMASPVPLPASAWLLLSGLSGLGALRKRRQQQLQA